MFAEKPWVKTMNLNLSKLWPAIAAGFAALAGFAFFQKRKAEKAENKIAELQVDAVLNEVEKEHNAKTTDELIDDANNKYGAGSVKRET